MLRGRHSGAAPTCRARVPAASGLGGLAHAGGLRNPGLQGPLGCVLRLPPPKAFAPRVGSGIRRGVALGLSSARMDGGSKKEGAFGFLPQDGGQWGWGEVGTPLDFFLKDSSS